MLTIAKSKFFNRYLPLILSVILVVGAAAVYLVFNPNNNTAEASWYNSSWGYRKPITVDSSKIGARNTQAATFSTVGSNTWIVPAGVSKITIKAWGAGGGGASIAGAGGGGGFTQGTFTVNAGDTLTVNVGGHGSPGQGTPAAGSGGTNGGGNGGSGWTLGSSGGGGGGGYTSIQKSSNNLIIAGGGGGAGGAGAAGGAGGGSSGVAGVSQPGGGVGGGAGTSSAGGAAGGGDATAGSANTGGKGDSGSSCGMGCSGSGGGGGGYYGGGGGFTAPSGGAGSGGGGGSDFATSTASGIIQTAGSGSNAANTTDPNFPGSSVASGGGVASSGGDGYVAILYTYTPGSVSNFPMLLSVTDPDLKYTGSGGLVASSTGADILFTDTDGATALNYEIESYASTTGQLIAWIQIPSLSPTADHTIYEYFGNANAPAEASGTKTGTWDSNFVGVWHLPNGTTLTANDSTSNANNGSLTNTPTAASGQIDGAATFNGSNNYINVPDASNLRVTNFTLEAWFKATAFGGRLLDKATAGSSSNGFIWDTFSSKLRLCAVSCQGGNTTMSTGAWYHGVLTASGTLATFYVNGVLDTSGTSAGTIGTSTLPLRIAADSTGSNVFNGTIDEARVSNTARSVDWIATEYTNQYSPSTFYAYGSLGIQNRAATTAGEKFRGAGSASTPAVKIRSGVKFR